MSPGADDNVQAAGDKVATVCPAFVDQVGRSDRILQRIRPAVAPGDQQISVSLGLREVLDVHRIRDAAAQAIPIG